MTIAPIKKQAMITSHGIASPNINVDKDGNIIPDLSKKTIPKDLSDVIVEMIYEARSKEVSWC